RPCNGHGGTMLGPTVPATWSEAHNEAPSRQQAKKLPRLPCSAEGVSRDVRAESAEGASQGPTSRSRAVSRARYALPPVAARPATSEKSRKRPVPAATPTDRRAASVQRMRPTRPDELE